ncbi:rhodanese-related sulfurtransferase [Cyanobium gracile]|uniref:tRNA uridine(34) hydroxylase n=1 Tax=Cyanobium gracile UHCC 0281 TaxID=3110309 RepID=A0ABU5SUY0_9CYAN|nr:rhodanese-related sulfurtransferase [Cyanobium gracile]MEA5442303.1 rhodanese-related sulfurtransferase [Cyanobium gracile UHCC 0281]
MRVQVAAFYRFVTLASEELPDWQTRLLALGSETGLLGTILLATEGINGTVAGSASSVAALLELLQTDPRLANLAVKRSEAEGRVFHRFKVRLKAEIVTMAEPSAQPSRGTGVPVPPEHWNALLGDPDTLTIDTRNHYEVALGSFAGAIDPGTETFSDFPAWVEQRLRPLLAEKRPQRLALFCTGGIRCEKATAYLLAQGFEDVLQLQGGILNYLEQVPEAESRWQGECYVFDQRVALNHQLQPGCYHVCHACGLPLAPADLELDSYVAGVSCRHCIDRFTPADRKRFAERQRQMRRAEACGEPHIGRVMPPAGA